MALLGLALSTGCVARGYIVAETPPAPRHVVVDVRPGFVWIEGHWVRSAGNWSWIDGYWVAERPGYLYVQGTWVRDGSRWRWRAGEWRARAVVNVHPGKARGHGKDN
jgi:hypothetical protein